MIQRKIHNGACANEKAESFYEEIKIPCMCTLRCDCNTFDNQQLKEIPKRYNPPIHSDMHIWVPSFWTLRISGNLVQGPNGTLAKGQGSFNLLIDYGAKRACF
jgi:hypothetical protein